MIKLTFAHPEFEQEVRERIKVFDRDLVAADALLTGFFTTSTTPSTSTGGSTRTLATIT